MARPRKPSRLYLHPTERTWLIRDGSRFVRTGCAEGDIGEAEQAHTEYNAAKFTARVRVGDPAALTVAEVLNAYTSEHAINLKSAKDIASNIGWLAPFFGTKRLSEINSDICTGYATWRRKQGKWPNRPEKQRRTSPVKNGTIRCELAILSASIGYWHKNHGPLSAVPVVTMPKITPGRDKFLEREQRVRRIAGALGFWQQQWCDVATRKTDTRWHRIQSRINYHLARFILLGLATGSRKGVILGARWTASVHAGWVDVDKQVIHRRALDEIETNKRKPPSALGSWIMAHLRRWKRIDAVARDKHIAAGGSPLDYQTIIHRRGKELADIKKAWNQACDLAYLQVGNDGFVRHTLRHTRATMLLREGVDPWIAAGQLGMSQKMLDGRYGHHSPHFQDAAKKVR